jgi:membrane fusion protein, macrolide-specific efflux system
MKNFKLWIIVFVLLASAGSWYLLRTKATKTDSIATREYKLEKGDIRITIKSTGTVQPENRLEIKPPIAGRIESVLVKEGDRVRRSQVLAWMSSTERAAVLDAARAKGPEEVAKWEDLYRATPVMSPISGTLISRKVEPGQTFTSTEPILVVSDRLTVKAQVDETDLAKVKNGMLATVRLDAYSGSEVPAKVSRIAFEATTVNNVTMYQVDVTPIETPTFMRSGMTASVLFQIEEVKDALLIPNDAIVLEKGQSYARLKSAEAKSKEDNRRAIELGVSDGKVTAVLGGLNVGDVVLAPRLSENRKENGSTSPFMPTRPPGSGSGRSQR